MSRTLTTRARDGRPGDERPPGGDTRAQAVFEGSVSGRDRIDRRPLGRVAGDRRPSNVQVAELERLSVDVLAHDLRRRPADRQVLLREQGHLGQRAGPSRPGRRREPGSGPDRRSQTCQSCCSHTAPAGRDPTPKAAGQGQFWQRQGTVVTLKGGDEPFNGSAWRPDRRPAALLR